MALILLRYGELTLKSPRVRRRFEERLLRDISVQFERYYVEYVAEKREGRMFIHVKDEDREKAVFILKHIPGIFSLSPVEEFEIIGGLEVIAKKTAEFAARHLHSGMSFAVRVRRTGNHSFTSQEAAGISGERILNTIPGLRVNLTEPDMTIFLEIRSKKGYLFTEQIRGEGGLPSGSQGKVILLLSGMNSMTAGYLLHKRGCRLIAVNFSLPPAPMDELKRAFEVLESLQPGMEFRTIEGKLSGKRIEDIAENTGAMAVVLGAGFDGFDPDFSAGKLPIFYPLIGLEDDEVRKIQERAEEFFKGKRKLITN